MLQKFVYLYSFIAWTKQVYITNKAYGSGYIAFEFRLAYYATAHNGDQ